MRKVLTTLNPRSASSTLDGFPRNQFKTPESDKAVVYNSNGFLELDNPIIRCPCNQVVTADLEDTRTYSYESTLVGGYFNASVNIDPRVLTPYRSFLVFDGIAPSTWTFPDPDVFLNYLRTAFPGLLIGGLSWDITIVNSSDDVLTVTCPPPGGTGLIQRYGFNNGNSHDIPVRSSVTFTIILLNTTAGSENVNYIIS